MGLIRSVMVAASKRRITRRTLIGTCNAVQGIVATSKS
jgi:hypothetical protein